MNEIIEVNKNIRLYMFDLEEWIVCKLLYVETFEDARDEVAGAVFIEMQDRTIHLDLWGNAEEDESMATDYDGCYVCFPFVWDDELYEEYEEENDEHDYNLWHFSDLV